MSDAFENSIEEISEYLYEYETNTGNSFTVGVMKNMIPIILEKELTDRQRECIELAYFKNMSQRQVAKKLWLTQPTVKKHIDNGCERMRNILKYCFYAVEKTETFYLEN